MASVFRTANDWIDKNLFGGRIKSSSVLERFSADQIADILDYRSYDDDEGVFYNEESVGIVFEFVPLLGVDEKIYNIVNSLYSRGVPNNLNLQIMTYSSPKVGTVLDVFSEKSLAPESIYDTVSRHRARHFAKGAWNSLSKRSSFKLRTHRTFISASIVKAENPDAVRDIKEFAESLQNMLQQISPDLERFKPIDLIRLTSDILNPTREKRPSASLYDEFEDINHQIMSPDTLITHDVKGVSFKTIGRFNEMTAVIGDEEFESQEFIARTLEAKNFPLHMYFGDMSRAIGDLFASGRHSAPVIMTLNIYYPNEGDSKAVAQMKHIRATNNAASPVAKYMPEMLKKAQDWNHASEALTGGNRIVSVRFQTTVIAPPEEIDKAERDTRNLLTSMDFDMRASHRAHLPSLMMGLPMGMGTGFGTDFRRMKRYKTMVSTMLPHASPFFGEYLGCQRPVMMMVGRCGQLYFWDNYSNVGAGNQNGLIMAESGGGKSVWMNEFVYGTCANGGHAIVYDDGYSFKNHCLLVGGKHYRFSLNDDFGLNVFDMVDYEKAALDEEYRSMCIEMCKAVIIQMVFAQQAPFKEQVAIIEEAILDVMANHKGSGTIDLVRDYLLAMDDKDLMSNTKSMAKSISTYCTGGVFGKFFNHRNTLDVTSHLTVFELSPLEQKPDLRSVVLTALLFMTDQKIVSDVTRRDLVVLDEAHKHIGNPNVCGALQGWARRVRKYNGALFLATQSAKDFDLSPDSRAIFENCGWKVTLKSSTAGVEAAADMRVFPDEYSKRLARNADVSSGEFSECVIIGGGSYNLGRLVLDPFTINLFTTTAEDVAAINNLVARGLSLQEAIYSVSGLEPLEPKYKLSHTREYLEAAQ